MLDFDQAALVRELGPYVTECIWFGKPNFMSQRLTLNGAPDDIKAAGKFLADSFTDEYIKDLYEMFKDNTGVKWKESIKKVVGIEVPTESGLDI